MAYATGTAEDFIDFLRMLRDYASGAIEPGGSPTSGLTGGIPVPVADQWTVLANGSGMPSLPTTGFATDGEIYLQGPGSDPADQIIVGVKTYRSVGANVFGWDLRGFTAFNSALTFDTLPGVSPAVYAAFDDAAFDCWFWVDRRRIMALARVGTTDILVHLGFIQQFGTRNQYPYPLLIGGSQDRNTASFQTNNFGQSSLPDPCDNGAQLRWVDGSWQEYRNYSNNQSSRSLARISTGNVVWPHRNSSSNADGVDSTTAEGNEDALFEAFSVGSSVAISSGEIGEYALFPAILTNGTQLVGRIDGIYTVFGLGLVSGDTITDNSESPSVVYDVFANTWRTEPVDFIAIRRS